MRLRTLLAGAALAGAVAIPAVASSPAHAHAPCVTYDIKVNSQGPSGSPCLPDLSTPIFCVPVSAGGTQTYVSVEVCTYFI